MPTRSNVCDRSASASSRAAERDAMKILLTGASGPLGRAVSAALSGEHEIVRIIGPSRTSRDSSEYPVDISDTAALARIVESERPEAVVHLAAITGAAAASDPGMTHRVNVEATHALALRAARAGVRRLVFASSAAVYGDGYDRPVSEEDQPAPQSLYARTKLEAEAALDAVAASDGLSSIALRIFNVYGPGFGSSLIQRVRYRSSDERLVLAGLDDFVRDYVHVADVATAIESALVLDSPASGVVNIGTGVPTTNRRIVELFGLRPGEDFEVLRRAASYSVAEISRARRTLGFSPRPLTVRDQY
ncbi:NAD-dependent epimerase/dehydratase family protein [Agromyces albus]|uniref:NAD(P)-dependent oxidoreductase n=1 Tax=Agromyces albus TaxID=205332 RepID=A0A4Q2L1X1_9MICO|nr:NAD(P)-dependent oxidoreductase [Agromyces albus]RXZ72074.1 NAD(P)-dependent oxidoreductase [Agromyces albus]